MTLISPVLVPSQRRVRAPVSLRKKVVTTTRPVLPRELALTRAHTAFRCVAWSPIHEGSAAPPSLPPPPPTAPARVVFAQVAWSGERAAPSTQAQSSRCVDAILKSFRWE